jgi:hypothetical protein
MAGAGPPHTAEHPEITVKSTETPADQPTPAAPQPNTVIDEDATVDNCAADYQQRTEAGPGGHFTATPHTYRR